MTEILQQDLLLALPGEFSAQISQAVELLDASVRRERFALGLASCHHGTGTSSMALALAGALAAGRRHPVCLVEANLRTPVFADALRLRSDPGLRELLDGQVDLEATLQRPSGHDASVITGGSHAGTDVPQFSRPVVREAIEGIRARFQAAIFDAAPLLIYPDTVALARHLDGIVLVVHAEHDRWEVVQQGARMLEAAGVRILGVVLNRKPLFIPKWLYRLL